MATTLRLLRAPKCSLQTGFKLPLCQKGCDQATHAGIELRETPIDVILCSPLPYAVETAHEISNRHRGKTRPAIEIHPNLIAKSSYSAESTVMSNVKIMVDYILEKFKRKSILLISHEEIVQGFIANHLGVDLGVVKTWSWTSIERGEIIVQQFIET